MYIYFQLPNEDIVRLGCHLTASRLMILPFLETQDVRLSIHMARCGEPIRHLFTRNLTTRPEASMKLKNLMRRKTREREVITKRMSVFNKKNTVLIIVVIYVSE